MDAYQKQLLAQSVATAGATAAFSAVPFVGPFIGPAMGGLVGSQVGKLFAPKKKTPKLPMDVREGSTGMSYAKGGFLPIGKNKYLVQGNNHNNSKASGVKLGDIELEGGEVVTKMGLGGKIQNDFVFSKRLKNTGTGKSFADTAKDTKSQKELTKLAVKQETLKRASSEVKSLPERSKLTYAAGGYLPYAASALNVGMALFGKQQTSNIPDVDTRAVDRMETTVNVDPQLQAIKNAQQNTILGSGNNLNAALASQANATSAISEVYNNKNTREQELRNQKTTQYLGLAEQQRQINAQRAQEELAGKQARVNMLTEGLVQAGNTYLNQKADASRERKELAGLNIQASMIPDEATRKQQLADIKALYTPIKQPTLGNKIGAIASKVSDWATVKSAQLGATKPVKNNLLKTPVVSKPNLQAIEVDNKVLRDVAEKRATQEMFADLSYFDSKRNPTLPVKVPSVKSASKQYNVDIKALKKNKEAKDLKDSNRMLQNRAIMGGRTFGGF